MTKEANFCIKRSQKRFLFLFKNFNSDSNKAHIIILWFRSNWIHCYHILAKRIKWNESIKSSYLVNDQTVKETIKINNIIHCWFQINFSFNNNFSLFILLLKNPKEGIKQNWKNLIVSFNFKNFLLDNFYVVEKFLRKKKTKRFFFLT